MYSANPKQLRQAAKEITQNSREYKKLVQKCFRKYKNYISYKEIALAIAAHLETVDLALSHGVVREDPSWFNASHSMFGLYNNPQFPVYALKEELFDAFLNSDPPQRLWEMSLPFERAVVVLPKGRLKNPNGMNVDWLIVDFLDPKKVGKETDVFWEYLKNKSPVAKLVLSRAQLEIHDTELRLRWCTITDYQFAYSSIKAMTKPGEESKIPVLDHLTPNDFDDEDKERKFTEQVTGLVSLLAIFLTRPKFKKELETLSQAGGFQPTRKKRNDPKLPKNYVMIGENFKIKRVHKGGTHASPDPHYRRGHCRTLSWRDAGEQEIWIPPTWVG